MVKTGIGQVGPDGFDPYYNGLKYIANSLVNGAKNVVTNAKSAVSSAAGQVSNAVANAAASAKDYASRAGQWIYDAASGIYKKVGDAIGTTSGSLGGSFSSGSLGSNSESGFVVKDGKVQFADPNLQYIMQMINQQSAANNEWSAEQAQKQMDFQKMMSDTAHQREVADLQAAGLNPVLSAGGSGAQVTSGAMAQADDSNTRLIAELAMSALDAMSNTAVGVAASAGGSNKSSIWNNYYVRRAAGSFASQLGWKAAASAAKLLF